jgi:cation:H+ antiporter
MLYLELLLALGVLTLGADGLVRCATGLAARCGVPSLLIGLTVVAFGTSAPELAVSLDASLSGRTDLAVGNVVGSNVFNVLFILGLSALVASLEIARKLVRLDIPLMIAVSLLLLVMAMDGELGRLDGALLAAGAVAYTVFSIRVSRAEDGAAAAQSTRASGGLAWDLVRILVGLALLVLGARWFVSGATELARSFGMSELVIGLTIVAAGTSLPEVATSIVAALRGERDVAVGNVVGSNLLNVLAILGLCALLAPDGLPVSPAVLRLDLPVMIAVAIATLPLAIARGRIARWEGALFLVGYGLYAAYLVLQATEHDSLPRFSAVMLEFVLPLVAVTLIVLLVQGLQHRHGRDGGESAGE